MDELKQKIAHLDSKISLTLLPTIKELVRKANITLILLWAFVALGFIILLIGTVVIGFWVNG